jgi:hypothetical protein
MARDAEAKSTTVGRQSSSPVISVFLMAAGYGGTVPETLRHGANMRFPERYSPELGSPDGRRLSRTLWRGKRRMKDARPSE